MVEKMDVINKKIIAIGIILMILMTTISFFLISLSDEVDTISEIVDDKIKMPLTVSIIPSSTTGSAPLKINYTAIIQNNQSEIFYHWDFGDGIVSEEPNPSHIYEKEGKYNCTLEIKDSNFQKSNDQVILEISKNMPPIIKILVNKPSKHRFEKFTFDAYVFDVDSEKFTYNWEIIYPEKIGIPYSYKTDEKNFTKQILILGTFNVILTVTDDSGNSVTDTIRLTNMFVQLRQFTSSLISTLAIIESYIPSFLSPVSLITAFLKIGTKLTIFILYKLGIWDKIKDKFEENNRTILLEIMNNIEEKLKIRNFESENVDAQNFEHINNMSFIKKKLSGIAIE